jgi:hypothetical protein
MTEANSNAAAAGKIVYVGCKLPNGLLMELIKVPQQKNAIIPVGRTDEDIVVRLNGANSARIARTNPAEHAYGITEVDETFAKAWFEANKGLKFVKEGIVFMVGSQSALKGEIKDRTGDDATRTGLEPIKTDGTDPRQQSGVEADKEQLRRLGAQAA